MATDTDPGDGLMCRRCSFPHQAGDQFCQNCGDAVVPRRAMPPPLDTGRSAHNGGPVGRGRGVPAAQQDATTRYLCAAAHLDPAFSDRAIAELLVEPVRALPPAPGVDSAAVLREAVAARARRRIRDVVLLILLVLFAYVSPLALVLWLVVALPVSIVAAALGSSRPAALLGNLGGTAVSKWRNAAILGVVVIVGIALLPQLYALVGAGVSGAGQYDVPPYTSPFSLGTVLVGALLLAVIALDEFTVHHLVYTSFRRGSFIPDGRRAGSDWERATRTLGHAWFLRSLARIEAADEHPAHNQDLADVVVHRGFSPFIGAGEQVHRKIIPLPLEPATPGNASGNGGSAHRQPRPISVVELHEYVAAAMDELRSSSSLGPGGRLGGLTRHEQILMAADRLLRNLDTQPQPAVLADVHRPPATHLPLAAARHLADTPQEWARYFQCFRIESWDRDLTTSCYLYAGTDQRMLCLEWTFCILPPIRSVYRKIDRLQNPILAPLGSSIMELVTLPATVIHRLSSVFHRFKPLRQRDGELVPDRYGAGKSLREIAAADDVQTYFQDVDVERYVKILDATLFRAVGKYLEDCGYSVVEFMKLADPVVNQLSISGGTFLGSAVGFGNIAKGNNINPSTPPKAKP